MQFLEVMRFPIKYCLTTIQFVLNLLQTESFGFHNDEQCEEESSAATYTEEPERTVTSD